MINPLASLLAIAALAGCANEPVAWSVPAGSVADPADETVAFVLPPNVFAGPIHVAASPVASHASMPGMTGSAMDHSQHGGSKP
jgi:hypothetical protein